MIEILKALIDYYAFLFDDSRSRIINSKSFNSSEALIDIECGHFVLSFIREKGKIFMEISGRSDINERYDFYLLQQYFKEVTVDFLDLDERAAFLKRYLVEIDTMFSELNLPQTKERLNQLRRARS